MENKDCKQNITPWEAKVETENRSVSIDYQKIISQFGCKAYEDNFTALFEKITEKPAHMYFRRGIAFAHRDFDIFLKKIKKSESTYLYTGRGPSSKSMHLGHAIPFLLCKYFQDSFKIPLVIQITDDEKFLWKEISIDESIGYGKENIKDIIAFGFDPKLTYIFSNTEESYRFQKNILKIDKSISLNEAIKVFGFDLNSNIGQVEFPSKEIAPCFPLSFGFLQPKSLCLIPCAVDQDPYFRLARKKASMLDEPKPASLYVSLLPDLKGVNRKMSASDPNSSIYLTDSPKTIAKKINKHAFSGGKETLEEHRLLGGNTEIDIPYQYLKYFYHDDEDLDRLRKGYEKGTLSSGEMKKKCINVIQNFVTNYQLKRGSITDEDVKEFTDISNKF